MAGMAGYLLGMLIPLCISGFIGKKIGGLKGREKAGWWLGFFLPIVGWIIAALLPRKN